MPKTLKSLLGLPLHLVCPVRAGHAARAGWGVASNELVDKLRVEITRLRSALAYWLPHETMVADDDKSAWNAHFALLESEPCELPSGHETRPETEAEPSEESEAALA